MNVNTVTRHLTTLALCAPMFCLIQKTGPTSVTTRLVAKRSTILDHSGNSLFEINNVHVQSVAFWKSSSCIVLFWCTLLVGQFIACKLRFCKFYYLAMACPLSEWCLTLFKVYHMS